MSWSNGGRLRYELPRREVDKSPSQQVDPEREGECGLVYMTGEQLDRLRHADPWEAAEILRDLLPPKP